MHVTVVVPRGKALPEAGTHETVGLRSQLSLAVGVVKVTTEPDGPVHSTVTFPGQVRVGGVVSRTTTEKPQLDEFGGLA